MIWKSLFNIKAIVIWEIHNLLRKIVLLEWEVSF